MVLRPYGILIDGFVELGLEMIRIDGEIIELRPHTGIPEPYLISPAFVNAHSHFEYRGLQGAIQPMDYWGWLRALTELKSSQDPAEVVNHCRIAAKENRRTGVALLGEHSDRPGAASAMQETGLDGVIFQEVITFFERESPETKLELVQEKAEQARAAGAASTFLNPHALYTVDPETLETLGRQGGPISLHFAETPFERDLLGPKSGPIAAFYRDHGAPFPKADSMLDWLLEAGFLRPGVQLVHACDLDESEIQAFASRGMTVAHCPRSNEALGCPIAPIFEMLRAGIAVGLGLDSAASSGPIDMFAEMRAAREMSLERGRPLRAEEVYRMATRHGAESLPVPGPNGTFGKLGWDIFEGSTVPLIKLHLPGAANTDALLDQGTPDCVEWLT